MTWILSIVGLIPKIFGIKKYYVIIKFCRLIYSNKLSEVSKLFRDNYNLFDNIFQDFNDCISSFDIEKWNPHILQTDIMNLRIDNSKIYLYSRNCTNEVKESILKNKNTTNFYTVAKHLIQRSNNINRDITESKIKKELDNSINNVNKYYEAYR